MNPQDEMKPLLAVKNSMPEIEALIKLNARPGVDIATIAMQELEYLRMLALTKPEILECMPQSVVLAVKTVVKQNLSMDPYAALVYVKTRNVRVGTDAQGKAIWKKALEISPSANGLISIARQYGRILDIKRPEVVKDDGGKIIGVSVELLLPSSPDPRWEKFKFDEDDFYRWQRASHKENGRNKNDADNAAMNYANENYTNFKGGIDPEFARAKAVRHSLKKLGTNQNEVRMEKITFTTNKTIIIDPEADQAASIEDQGHAEVVEQTLRETGPADKKEVKTPSAEEL